MNIDRSLDQHIFDRPRLDSNLPIFDFWPLIKRILAAVCLVASVCGLVAIGALTYGLWDTYWHLQASNASGAEYLPFVMAPGMYAFLFAISGIAFSCSRRLLQRHSVAGDILGTILLVGFGLSLGIWFVI